MTHDRMVTKMQRDYGWHRDLCISIADRLTDPAYMADIWPNLARDYPGITLGKAAEIIDFAKW